MKTYLKPAGLGIGFLLFVSLLGLTLGQLQSRHEAEVEAAAVAAHDDQAARQARIDSQAAALQAAATTAGRLQAECQKGLKAYVTTTPQQRTAAKLTAPVC